jgi:hypothetical protein
MRVGGWSLSLLSSILCGLKDLGASLGEMQSSKARRSVLVTNLQIVDIQEYPPVRHTCKSPRRATKQSMVGVR